MEFRYLLSRKVFMFFLFAIPLLAILLWKIVPILIQSTLENQETVPLVQIDSNKGISIKPILNKLSLHMVHAKEPELNIDDFEIQRQLDRDRKEQKQTKYLRNQLEQTNLELEQEKALAEINKLRMENVGNLKEQSMDEQKIIPDVKVEYIGGDNIKKEAILSIAGANYQVKEKSNPTDNIQVISISDSSVTLHFNAPQELTKIIDYKPE